MMALKRAIAPILALTIGIGVGVDVGVGMGTAAQATLTEDQIDEQEEAIEELGRSSDVFQEISTDPETQIPPTLIQQSAGIIIVTNMGQGGFIVGGRRGDGLMVARQADGTWSNPAFMTLGGGSFGLQFGGRNSDLVLLVMNPEVINDILEGDIELGATVTGTAGPVGATVTDPAAANNDILIYSRSTGLFGGVTASGSTIEFDEERNEVFYGVENITPYQIFTDPSLTPIVSVSGLMQTLQAGAQ